MSRMPHPEPWAKAMPSDRPEDAFYAGVLVENHHSLRAPLQDNRLLPGKPERDPKMAEFAKAGARWESAWGDLCHRSSGQLSSEYLNRMLNEHHSHSWFRTFSSNRHANAG
ncbi:hypothetical protein [Bradyrhizobium nanningense]|uniref:hypothetical protein n=1 Tax=Bradyrhizobium nanningense TaxID=1325118 RepID=UPI0010089FD0|nr:hypothetical protein [Bradyrhizobium nanningense]